jgi:PKHD-type hydroxylase
MYPFAPSPDAACNETTFAFWEKVFNDEEIEKIIEIGESQYKMQAAKTAGEEINQTSDGKARKSQVSWIELTSESQFIYDRIRDIVTLLNGKFFQFDLYGFVEHIQYTLYDGENSHYTWHVDKGITNASPRKLSVVIQLSDPSEYDGGNLELLYGDQPDRAKKAKGMMYVFPSYLLHRVTPITSGKRRSLVVWLSGPKFR